MKNNVTKKTFFSFFFTGIRQLVIKIQSKKVLT